MMKHETEKTLLRCGSCGVPLLECCRPFQIRNALLTQGDYRTVFWCQSCIKDTHINCSHCNKALPEDEPLPELADGESYLCEECTITLTEGLHEFTMNGGGE